MMMILTNKQKYVSQLPLANKSILSQGHFVSSVFVDHLSVDIMLDQYEVKCNLKLFNITNTSLSQQAMMYENGVKSWLYVGKIHKAAKYIQSFNKCRNWQHKFFFKSSLAS